ncbi:MAG: ELM1/GtrOC1 family putative glycosyltransferase [Alphaproteobacteria bacterium]
MAWADIILVTADSASMLSEAATTGKPVYMIELEGGAPRLNALHRNLIEKKIVRPFEGVLENWSYDAITDAQHVADAIRKRLEARGIRV